MEEIRENKMGTMPVGKLLITTSLPMMISMLVLALYNIVDSYFVAKIHEDAMTALSLAFPIQNLMIAFSVGTGVGVNALLSKSLGEKNQTLVNKSANNAIFIYFCTFLLFAIAGLFVVKPFFALQHATDLAVEYGISYLSIIMICSFGVFAQGCMERLLISTGRTIYSMITQIVGAVINIILDPILIFGYLGAPQMGVKGAAIATIIGQCCAAALGIYFNRKFNPEIKLSFKMMKPDWQVIGRIYKVGLPSIVMSSISSVMVFGMNKILMSFTQTAVTVFGAYFKLQSFIFMPVFGMNSGLVPIIAYNYGARNYNRITGTLKKAVKYSVSIMVVGCALFELFPAPLLSIFSASDTMLQIGVPALRIIAIHFPIAGAAIMFMSTLQALGKSIKSLIVSLLRQLCALLPSAWLLAQTGNLNMVWFAFPIAEAVSITCVSLFLRMSLKEIKKEIQPTLAE